MVEFVSLIIEKIGIFGYFKKILYLYSLWKDGNISNWKNCGIFYRTRNFSNSFVLWMSEIKKQSHRKLELSNAWHTHHWLDVTFTYRGRPVIFLLCVQFTKRTAVRNKKKRIRRRSYFRSPRTPLISKSATRMSRADDANAPADFRFSR